MTDILKGNFKPKREVEIKTETETLEGRFEREAMKRLGGSIAFVAKHKVMWGDEAVALDPKPDETK
jgi:hypothetical protein